MIAGLLGAKQLRFMFNLTSNAESILVNLQRDLVFADDQLEQNLRLAAVNAVALVSNRIQQTGTNSSGQRLQTKALLRNGAYSKSAAKHRSERGRRIDQMDWTDTGDMMRSFQVLAVSPRLATAGFLNDEEADKAGYLEAYFGDTFYLSDSEQATVGEGLLETILDDMNGRR